MDTITYYKQIQANPHFRLCNFAPLIKRAIEEGREMCYTQPLELGGVVYKISFDPTKMTLTIGWTEDGKKNERKVQVIKEKSNLPSLSGSYVYYFLCPSTGSRARVIYRVGSFFVCRRAIKAYYPLQMESRHNRTIHYREAPYRDHGKIYYRGKLTPYGKRCIRYEKRESFIFGEMEEFLERIKERLQNLNKENAKRNAPPSRTRSKPQRSKQGSRRKSGCSLLPDD